MTIEFRSNNIDDADLLVVKRYESLALQCWFNLSYSSWLTLPRVLMEAMPFEWQDRMAALLNEYDAAFPNQPDLGTRVQVTDGAGHLIKTPRWLINYRRPDREAIERLRTFETEENEHAE